MRNRLVLVATAILALLLTPAAAAAPDGAARLRDPAYRFTPAGPSQYGGLTTVNQGPDARADTQTHAPFAVPTQDNLTRVIYPHFGSLANGQAMIETWVRVTYDDGGLPITIQGFGSATRSRNVARIAIRTVLHTRGGVDSDDATGPTVNSANQGNPVTFNAVSPTLASPGYTTPDITGMCEAWTTVHYAIRWTDGSLTSGRTLTAASDWFNTRCFFLGGP